MNEKILSHLDKIEELLDQSQLMNQLTKTRKLIFQDQKLLDQIEQYKKSSDQDFHLKKQIYENELYRTYQSLENELFYLILSINERLNQLTEGKRCQHESN